MDKPPTNRRAVRSLANALPSHHPGQMENTSYEQHLRQLLLLYGFSF